MRIIVTGGRSYADRERVFAVLDEYAGEDTLTIVHGGCPTGADHWANEWMLTMERGPEVFPADWKKHGRGAGPIRNQRMVDAGADLCIVFPGGQGTFDCVRRARKAGIEVREVTSTEGMG